MPRLLLVDDNPSIHRIVVSLLASTDIEISYAQSSSEALDLISKEAPFGLAMIDTSLPDADGWDLLGRLRSGPGTSEMPIAMMAGVLEEVDLSLEADARIQAFLRKPIDLRDLPEKVQALFGARSSLGQPDANLGGSEPQMSIPSDLILLGEQDLGPSEADRQEGQSADAQGAGASLGPDEKITLELEALDFRDFDHLAQPEGGPQPRQALGGPSHDPRQKATLDPLEIPDSILVQHAGLLDIDDSQGASPIMADDEYAGIGAEKRQMLASSIASELLSSTKFLDALAKAVEERGRCKGL